MITDVPGLRVGHWTDRDAATGCTVILLPEGTVASGEVRGGAPAEREMALLDPSRTVERLDALVLTGGSAFGLATADGAVRFCEEQGRGVEMSVALVPIVVALGLFDLDTGDPSVRPGAGEGYAASHAAASARPGPVELGSVGAGAGASVNRVGELTGTGERRPGGLVSATLVAGEAVVSALVVVNAFGDVLDAADPFPPGPGPGAPAGPGGADRAVQLATALQGAAGPGEPRHRGGQGADGAHRSPSARASTTIGLVATNLALDKAGCLQVAQAAHHGLAGAVRPSHTRFDGDAFVAASVGGVPAGAVGVDVARLLATEVVATAVRSLSTARGAPRQPGGSRDAAGTEGPR